MKKYWTLLFAVGVGMLPASRLVAHPYASGITNNNGTIYWILNESATDVKIQYDNNSVVNDLGSAPSVGTNSFALGSHTNYSIVVYKAGFGAVSQISSDSNPDNDFFGPRGVVVNQNPMTWNFGRIYVANANSGAAGSRSTTTRGIYVMDAASDDIFGRGTTAALGGMSLGTSTAYAPYRLGIGPDDALYVGDCSTGKIGGVWATDPGVHSSTNLFGLANPNTNTTSFGTNFGASIGTPNVTGSIAGGNLVVTLTSWYLSVANPPGTFPPGTQYQNIYQYNIGSGPLPWRGFPTVITNPISFGTFVGVTMDAQVAPDGKYFITAYRNSNNSGTNVCVLDKTGATNLWDSVTQSATYFNSPANDHLCLPNDYSISVSPDDKYVVISGQNNNFGIMSLTNGVPDISTLVTNTGNGSTGYTVSWDAADNLYATSGTSQTLRIFSLGLTTTCTTSNDFTGANGGFSLSAVSGNAPAISSQPANATGQCAGSAAFSVTSSGSSLAYQWYLNGSTVSSATSSSLTLANVTLSQSGGSYSVIVSNVLGTATSQVAVLTVVDTTAPVVTMNGPASTNINQGTAFTDPGATANDACAGSASVTTTGSVNVNSGGNYTLTYTAKDPSNNSAAANRTVTVVATNGAPVVLLQPASTTVECTSQATFSVTSSGGAPLSYQWYFGATPLSNGANTSGATSTNLTLSNTAISQTGSYSVIITNAAGNATSHIAVLTVHDTTPPVVTIQGSSSMSVQQSTGFTDPGATANDTCAGSLSVTTSGNVNILATGTYTLTYSTTDPSGNTASANRIVTVTPGLAPVTASVPVIIPLPVSMTTNTGVFTLCPSEPVAGAPSHPLFTILVDQPSLTNGQFLATTLFKSTGYRFSVVTNGNNSASPVKHSILLTTVNGNSSLGSEGYDLTVAPDSVVIQGYGEAGVFYGIQTLLQLLPPQIVSQHPVTGVTWTAPCVTIQDQPRFGWRGVMLDVARHFTTKQDVKTLMDGLAFHKLNTLHLHLCDDQGWRVEITNYPNLTVAGAWRGSNDYNLNPRSNSNTNSSGQYGGFYTQGDIRELVAYGQERYITIVPEIEIPAHSTAGLVAYPQFAPGSPPSAANMDSVAYGQSIYSLAGPGCMAFFEGVLTEVMQMFPSHYIHCGGDEVVATGDTRWESYSYDSAEMSALGFSGNIPGYQYWLSTNLATFLQANGRKMIGWTEFDNYAIVPNATLMEWEWASPMKAVAATAAGQDVVMSPNQYCYINYIETSDGNNVTSEGGGNPADPYFIVGTSPTWNTLANVYSWDPTNEIATANQSHVLGAQLNLWAEYVPSGLNVLFKMFPRACAIAEIGWTPKASRNFSNFSSRLTTHKQRLAQMGINYNHEGLVTIGAWTAANVTATYPSTATVTNIDISANVTAGGEIDIRFWYTGGGDGLEVTSVTLLENGNQIDVDSHVGVAGLSTNPDPVFVLHLPARRAGATYTIKVVGGGQGGTATAGTIYMANWN